MLKLVQPGSATTSEIEITDSGIVVGRERGCDLMLCSKSVSRQHAKFTLRSQIAVVEDLGSVNGTLVDGKPIYAPTELKPGCSITFGELTFFLIDDSSPAYRLQKNHDEARPATSEPKPIRRFSGHHEEKGKSTSAKSETELVSATDKPKAESSPSDQRPNATEKTYAREICAGLLILMLLGGFLLGRGASRLGALEFYGERSAMENLLTPEPAPESTASNDNNTTETATAPQSQVSPNLPSSVVKPSSPTVSAPVPQKNDSKPAAETESSGEMSINDSGKALRLMKEIQKLNVDMRDEEAVFKVATDKLGLTREQAKRAVKFVTGMAERKAIMDGGIDAIAKLKTKPVASSTTTTTVVPNTAEAALDPQSIVSPSATGSGQPEAAGANLQGADADQTTAPGSSVAESPSEPPTVVMAPVKRGPGFYLNAWGLVLVTGLLIVWRTLVAWMENDSEQFGDPNPGWLGFCTVSGPAGAMTLLACPDLGWGTMLNTAFIGVPLMAHLAKREERVPVHSRIFRLENWFGTHDASDFGIEPQKQTALEFLRPEGNRGRPNTDGKPKISDADGLLAAKSLMATAIARRAAMVRLQPAGDRISSQLLIDGDWRDGATYTGSAGRRLMSVFHELATPAPNAADGPLDGRFRIKIQDETFDVRAMSEQAHDQSLVIRLFRFKEELTNFSGLGCHRKVQGELRDIISRSEGLFLICGPAGSGRSTTIRSAVCELDPTVQKIVSVEDSVEYRISHITQMELDKKSGQSMASALKIALQQEPGVLVVGEIRDAETATAACRAAKQGHLVLSTMAAADPLAAMQQLIKMGVETNLLADALLAVLGQRLIRRLCPICKLEYHPWTDVLRKYRIPNDRDRILYCPPGADSTCEACEGVGYRGRIGIFELLTIDDQIRTLIRDQASPAQIKDAARRRGMVTLRECGFMAAFRGVTSLQEVDAATRNEKS